MKWREVCVPLVLDNPYMTPKKEIAPLVLGAIVAGGASLLGGIGNVISTNSTNNANRDIASQTNETNMAMNQQQLEWARQQYFNELAETQRQRAEDREWFLQDREYNSPLAESQRLLAAGINPYLAKYGSGSLGTSQMMSSSVNVPHANQPNMIPSQGYNVLPQRFDFLGDAGNMLFQLPFLESKREQDWVKVLSETPLDAETKDRLIKDKVFADDKAQKRFEQYQQESLMGIINDNSLKQLKLNIGQEENDAKRAEWSFLADKHEKELRILTEQINRFIIERDLLNDQHLLNKDKHSFNEKGLEVIQKEIDRIGRENDLWKGDFSVRNVFEMLRSIFTGGNLVSLLSLMK